MLENIKQKYYDAKLLNENGRFSNSIYLCGYCVELSLKLAITRKLNWSKYQTEGKFRFMKTHDFEILVALTGDELRIKQMPFWSIAMLWNEHRRYEDPASANQTDSDSMIEATKKLVEDLCKISL
jgi:HEPN domain-containing protein